MSTTIGTDIQTAFLMARTLATKDIMVRLIHHNDRKHLRQRPGNNDNPMTGPNNNCALIFDRLGRLTHAPEIYRASRRFHIEVFELPQFMYWYIWLATADAKLVPAYMTKSLLGRNMSPTYTKAALLIKKLVLSVYSSDEANKAW